MVIGLGWSAGVGAAEAQVRAAPPETKAQASHRVLLAPRANAKLPARPVKVILRHNRRVVDPLARLNSRRVGTRFSAPRKGRRRLALTAADGLRHGANRLVVRWGTPGHTKRRTVRFRVSKSRPLAGPRHLPRTVVKREPVLLDGRASRARPGGARGQRNPFAAGGMRYRWNLVKAPRGSQYRGDGAAMFNERRSLTASRVSFRPDEKGTYVFQLRVDDGMRSAPTKVEVAALPSRPIVPVQAFTLNGIQLGGDFYPASQDDGATMQLLVLERATLAPVSNQTIICPNGPGPECTQQTQSAVEGLTSDVLVIAAAVGPWTGQDTALASIGVCKVGSCAPVDPSLTGGVGGEFSAVGVPGMSPGEATQRAVSSLVNPEDPGVTGYLQRDLHSNYAFTSGDPLEYQFDTTNDTLTVGGQTLQAAGTGIPNCAGGFNLWVFDAIQMGSFVNPESVCTNVPGDSNSAAQGQNDLISLLTGANSYDLFFISSFGNPIEYVSFAQWGQLASAFDSVGGFHHVLNSIKSGPYTLVSAPGARFAGAGVETSTETSGPGDTSPGGVLFRDRASQYLPRVTDASGEMGYDLLQVVYQSPSPWPIPETPGQQAALAYIANQLDLGTDIRDDYWTQSYDGSKWEDIKGDLRALTYPGSSSGFTQSDFIAVQNELETEIGWVVNVINYIDNLSGPFSDDALADWAQVQAVAENVDTNIGTNSDDSAVGSVLDVIADVLDVSTYFVSEAVAPELGIAAGSLYLVADLADAEDGSSGTDPIRATVADYGAALAQRFEDAQTSYKRLQDIIVSDYGRLETVGTLGGCPPAAQNCPPQWQWIQGQSDEYASQSLLLTTRQQLYETFLPLKYDAWDITQYNVSDAANLFCQTDIAGGGYFPFPNATGSGQIFLRDDPANQRSHFVIGGQDQNSDGSYDTPAASLTDSLFAPPSQGGLGIYAPYLYLDAFQRPGFGPCPQ